MFVEVSQNPAEILTAHKNFSEGSSFIHGRQFFDYGFSPHGS